MFSTQRGVDGGVAGGTGEVLVLRVGGWRWVFGLVKKFREPFDDMGLVAGPPDTHQKMVGLDVALDQVAGVNALDARHLEEGRVEKALNQRRA